MDATIAGFKIDDVASPTKGKNVGQMDTVLEIDVDRSLVRLQTFGWYDVDALTLVQRPEPPAEEPKAASPVLSGTPEVEQTVGVEVTIEDLERQMAVQNDKVRALKETKKEIAADYKAAVNVLHAIVSEISYRRRKADAQQPLLFPPAVKEVLESKGYVDRHAEQITTPPAAGSVAPDVDLPADLVDENTKLDEVDTEIEPG